MHCHSTEKSIVYTNEGHLHLSKVGAFVVALFDQSVAFDSDFSLSTLVQSVFKLAAPSVKR